MNKAQLIETIITRVGDKRTATEAVNAIIDTIQGAVASGEKVSIAGFGSFEPVHKPAREMWIPSKGGRSMVKESWSAKFAPFADFKALVQEGGRGGLVGRSSKAA